MALSLDFLALPLLVAAALVFVSVLAGVVSTRAGFSFLLVFLLAGILAGEDGPGGLVFNDFRLSFWVGNIALAVILLDGGLRTDFDTFRTGLKPSLLLATLGVVLSAGITGAAARWLLDLSWPMALLVGAIVGSTDAAAVFSLLKSSGVRLNERVAATLEIESGMNDPMAVYLTLALIGVALAATTAGSGAGLSAGAGHWDWAPALRWPNCSSAWAVARTAAAASARCCWSRAG
jgi:cell volume regulation protein A